MVKAVRRLARNGVTKGDSGAAMVMVLGIMMVGAVVTTTLVMVTLYNTRNTQMNRMELQTLASADAGLDLMLDLYRDKQYDEITDLSGSGGENLCAQSFTINNATVNVTAEYTVTRGGSVLTVSCPDPSQGDIVSAATVTSTATQNFVSLGGQTVTQAVQATFVPTPPEVLLDKAIFSEATMTLTNDAELIPSGAVDSLGNPIADAHVYANGSITCQTNVEAGGSIYAAQGTLDIQNGCDIGNGVWARDRVLMSSQARVDGDVYAGSSSTASGNEAVRISNSTPVINGSVLTNGSIYTEAGQGQGYIRDNAFARLGTITGRNQSYIGGSAYAAGNIDLGNWSVVNRDAYVTGSGTITGRGTVNGNAITPGTVNTGRVTVNGTLSENTSVSFPTVPNPAVSYPSTVGYPGVIQAPQREQMPELSMTAADIAKWVGAGWTEIHVSGICNGFATWDYINNLGPGRNLVFMEGCTQPVDFNGAQSSYYNRDLVLEGDLALVSRTGFSFSNDVSIVSDQHPTTSREFYGIVPSDIVPWVAAGAGQTRPNCPAGGWPYTGDIRMSGGGTQFESVEMMFYTPCEVNLQNGLNDPNGVFKGQIYAGRVVIPSGGWEIQMNTMPVPSLSTSVPNLNDQADVRMTARFDLRE